MDNLGEGDIDIIKSPIVIDNVSAKLYSSNLSSSLGIWHYESWNWRRLRAIFGF